MRIFFLLGSNVGDRVTQLAAARQLLVQQVALLVRASLLYESEPWGHAAQPYFLNQALEICTQASPWQLLRACLSIEQQLGRRRGRRYAPRNIDIDLLYCGTQVIDTPALQLPHPEIVQRRFTLVPMVEIAPEWVHPLLQLRQDELLAACTDRLQVRPLHVP